LCSLHIHLPSCAAKFVARQQQLPPAARKPLPPRPPGLPAAGRALPTARAAIEEFNAQMFEAFNAWSLTRCGGCGRTFK
jgi:hypothetical protein